MTPTRKLLLLSLFFLAVAVMVAWSPWDWWDGGIYLYEYPSDRASLLGVFAFYFDQYRPGLWEFLAGLALIAAALAKPRMLLVLSATFFALALIEASDVLCGMRHVGCPQTVNPDAWWNILAHGSQWYLQLLGGFALIAAVWSSSEREPSRHRHDWAWGGDGTWDYCADPDCYETRSANQRGQEPK